MSSRSRLARVKLHTRAAPDVLTAGEAAALLRVSEPDVVAAAEAGELPARRIGGEWRFGREALVAWVGGAS